MGKKCECLIIVIWIIWIIWLTSIVSILSDRSTSVKLDTTSAVICVERVDINSNRAEVEDDLGELVNPICVDYGIDPKIIKAIIWVESGANSNVIGDNGRSYGLMQINKAIHQNRANKLGVTDFLNSEQNIRLGVDLFSDILQSVDGDLQKALTIYNAGHDTGDRMYANKVLSRMGELQ